MTWLIEFIGPQHSGKTTIANLTAFALESNGVPALRVETDTYVFNLFPAYRKLYALGKRKEASHLLDERWPFFHDVIRAVIRQGLAAGFTVLHDHVNTRPFRKGFDREVAARAKASHFSVMITAPLEILRERWAHANVSEESKTKLVHDYEKFQKIREENLCGMVIDTSITPVDAAVKSIVSALLPKPVLDLERMEMQGRDRPLPPVEVKPQLKAGLQVYRETDAYYVVYKHEGYVADGVGLKILSLCDGSNTLDAIAKKAEVNLAKVRTAVDSLIRKDMVGVSPRT